MKVLFGGGLNEAQTPDINEAAEGSYNFDLSKDSSKFFPRKPFDLAGTTTPVADIRGLLQLVKRDDTSSTLVQAGGTVYTWDGASTFSSAGTVTPTAQLRDVYWSLGDYIVTTDLQKQEVVKKWDGTTFSTLTTGLGTNLYAKYGVVHNGRMWFFNVKASAFENPTSYDTTQRAETGTFTTGLEAFYMLTPDLRPINGVAKTLAGDLIISTYEGSLFKLSGTDADTYKWNNFYPASQAVGTESMTNTGNDVMYMKKGGNIESLVATQAYGDVQADDLSRWIPSTVADLRGAIAVYDQKNQKVLFFTGTEVLVFFKDIFFGGAVVDKGKSKLSPWSVYKTTHSSGFATSCARYMRVPGTTDTTVYFGSSAGQIFNFNGTGITGDGGTTAIQVVRKTRFIDKNDGIDFLRHVTRGDVRYRRMDEVSLNIEMDWADEYDASTATVVLKGRPASDTGNFYSGTVYYGGVFYYNSGFAFTRKISHQNFSLVGKSPGGFMTLSTLDKKDYQIDHVELL
jgi:hypothetical protein